MSEASIGGLSDVSEAIPDTEKSFVTVSAAPSKPFSGVPTVVAARNKVRREQSGNPKLSIRVFFYKQLPVKMTVIFNQLFAKAFSKPYFQLTDFFRRRESAKLLSV